MLTFILGRRRRGGRVPSKRPPPDPEVAYTWDRTLFGTKAMMPGLKRDALPARDPRPGQAPGASTGLDYTGKLYLVFNLFLLLI